MARTPKTAYRWTPPAARIDGDRLIRARAAEQRVKDAAIQAKAEAQAVEVQAEKSLAEKVDELQRQIDRLMEAIPKMMPASGGGRRTLTKLLNGTFISDNDDLTVDPTKIPLRNNVYDWVLGNAPLYVATRTALKAIDTTKEKAVYLTEGARSGLFKWTTGNFSTHIAADTAEGVYVKATAIASSAGAWVRDYRDGLNVKWFGATGDGSTDDRAACQAAINIAVFLVGGDVIFPDGDYRLVGVTVGTDTMKTGIVVPLGGLEATDRIRLIGRGRARIFAGADGQILVRMSKAGGEVTGLIIDGRCTVGSSAAAGYTNVWGVGLVQQDRSDVTNLGSQSFCKVTRNVITQCSEGVVSEPGNTVGGSQAGGFYQIISDNDFNFNIRSIWCKPALNDGTNRPTRGTIQNNRITRGQVGLDLEYATEFNSIGNKYEFMLGATYGTGLRGAGCAIYVGALTAYCWSTNDFMEQCDNWYYLHASALVHSLFQIGNPQAGVTTNNTFTPKHAHHLLQLTRRTSSFEQLAVTFHHAGYARIVSDYGSANVRDLSIETNATRRKSWGATGIETFYGTGGNIVMDATGEKIEFTGAGQQSLAFTGTGGFLDWTFPTGTSWQMDGSAFYPVTNNVGNIGGNNVRVATGFFVQLKVGPASSGIIWTTGTGTPEGVVTAPVGSLFTRSDGGASTTLYVKQSGAGNTGWVAK